MKARKDLLTRDDWDLTRKSLEGQRGSMLIQLDTLEAAIVACENRVRSYPKPTVFLKDTDEDGDPIIPDKIKPKLSKKEWKKIHDEAAKL